MYPHLKEIAGDKGVLENLSTELSISTERKFGLVSFIEMHLAFVRQCARGRRHRYDGLPAGERRPNDMRRVQLRGR